MPQSKVNAGPLEWHYQTFSLGFEHIKVEVQILIDLFHSVKFCYFILHLIDLCS